MASGIQKMKAKKPSSIRTAATLEKRRTSGGVGGLCRGSNPLDSFFPFDPYLLRRSYTFVDPHYRHWNGSATVDGAPPEDEVEMAILNDDKELVFAQNNDDDDDETDDEDESDEESCNVLSPQPVATSLTSTSCSPFDGEWDDEEEEEDEEDEEDEIDA